MPAASAWSMPMPPASASALAEADAVLGDAMKAAGLAKA